MIWSFLQISTTLLVISVYIEWQRVTLAVCKTTHWCSFIKISVITWCDHLQCLLEELNLRQAATGMWCTRMHKMTELACMLCSGISQMFSSPSRLSHPPSLSFFFQFKSLMGDAVCKRLQSDRVQNKEDSQRKTGSYESHFNFPSLPLETKSFREQITLIVKLLLEKICLNHYNSLYNNDVQQVRPFLFVHNS